MSVEDEIFLNSCQFSILVMVNVTREYKKGAPLNKKILNALLSLKSAIMVFQMK